MFMFYEAVVIVYFIISATVAGSISSLGFSYFDFLALIRYSVFHYAPHNVSQIG